MTQAKVDISNVIRLRGDLEPAVLERIERSLTIPNPVWLENNKFGRYNRGVKKELSFLWKRGGAFSMPRGFAGRLVRILEETETPFEINDKTSRLPKVDFGFNGQLYGFQEKAAARLLSRRFGVVRMPTGAGKTVLALDCISRRRQPAAVVVHTKELLYQWRDKALEFMDIEPEDVGLIGDGKRQMGRKLTICVVNSLYKCASEVKKQTGHLVVDECHRIPSRSFTVAVRSFDSMFMLGLSATPFRRDGLTPLINFFMGDQMFHVDPKDLKNRGKISSARLIVRKTDFNYPYDDDYQQMVASLASDWDRNRMIANDAVEFSKKACGPALVVSDRKNHCRIIGSMIADKGVNAAVLTGDVPDRRRKEIVQDVIEGRIEVLVSTLQLIGEGFDCPQLSALFLATPVKFTGRVLQVVGRVLRTSEGKGGASIFDYVDRPGVLQASFNSRRRAYTELGIAKSAEGDRAF